jgi:hypothetical protein
MQRARTSGEGAMWYFARVFTGRKMINSADFISNVIMDCTCFGEKCKRFCFQHLLQNRKRSVFQANYNDLLH